MDLTLFAPSRPRQGGMWGNILVGVRPGTDLKSPEKTVHVHSADEEKEDHDHPAAPSGQKAPAAKPNEAAPKKPVEHEHHSPPAVNKTAEKPAADHQHGDPVNAGTEHASHSTAMSSSINIGEPMSREGSGSSWLPDSSPMYAWMKMYEDGSHLCCTAPCSSGIWISGRAGRVGCRKGGPPFDARRCLWRCTRNRSQPFRRSACGRCSALIHHRTRLRLSRVISSGELFHGSHCTIAAPA